MFPRKNTFQAETRKFSLFVPCLAHIRKKARLAQLLDLILVNINCPTLLVQLHELFEIFSGNQPVQVILLFESQPFEYALISPG
jgi:hypothetical protein